MLVGVGQRDPAVTLLGRRRPHPLIVAPMAYQRLAHPEGETGTARAAAATGSIICLSTFATTTPDVWREAAPDVSRWFQLYVLNDRGVSRELVAQAAANGYEALVVTVDLPVLGPPRTRPAIRQSGRRAPTRAERDAGERQRQPGSRAISSSLIDPT